MADKSQNTGGAVVGAGIVGGAAGYLASQFGKQVQAAPVDFKDIIALLNAIVLQNEEAIAAIKAISITGNTTPNAESFNCGTVGFQAITSPVNLPAYTIPDGMELTIIADTANIGTLQVSSSSARSKQTATSFPLAPGAGMALKVKSADAVWVSTSVVTDTFHWIVEGARNV